MELEMNIFSLGLVLFFFQLGRVEAQTDETGLESVDSSTTTSAPIQSEDEFWDYIEMLCQAKPTRRCKNDRIVRVRNGEIVPVPSYDRDNAYRTPEEVRASAVGETDPEYSGEK